MSKRTLVCIMRSKAGTAKWWPAVPILIPIKSTVEERQREIASLFPTNGLLKTAAKSAETSVFCGRKSQKWQKNLVFWGFSGLSRLYFCKQLGLISRSGDFPSSCAR